MNFGSGEFMRLFVCAQSVVFYQLRFIASTAHLLQIRLHLRSVIGRNGSDPIDVVDASSLAMVFAFAAYSIEIIALLVGV